jgi:Phosphatidylinositol-4-phosphate 5-Kinase
LNDPDHLSEFDSEYITKDKKYLIKIVDSDHLQKINSIAAKYVERASDRNSYLIVLYGIFSIEYKDSSTINFLVFENLGYDVENLRIETLIDEEVPQTYTLRLEKKILSKLKNEIRKDTKLLSKYEWLGYSLKFLGPLPHLVDHVTARKIIEYDNGNRGYLGIYYTIKDYRPSIMLNRQDYRQRFLNELNSTFISR